MTSLQDPQLEAFYATNPELLVNPATFTASAPHEPATQEKVAIEMAAAFLVVAGIVGRHLANQKPPIDVQVTAGQAWRHHAPLWLRLLTPAVKQAYMLGRVSGLTPVEMDAMATDYAEGLGDYVSQTSGEVLMQGFQQQLAANQWSKELAWHRASAAYGVDSANMRGIVATMMAGGAKGVADPVSAAARVAIDRALMSRATVLGQTESHGATQTGLAVSWMTRQAQGQLPATARRRWVGGPESGDCPICGPMRNVMADLSVPFELPDGQKLWAPGAHPHCTCRLELVDAVRISKAKGPDPFDRDKKGRFADREYRTREVTYAEPQSPEVTAMMDMARTIFGVETGPKEADLFKTPPTPTQLFGAKQQLFRAPAHDLFAKKPDLFAPDLFANGGAAVPDLFDPTGKGPAPTRKPQARIFIVGRKRQGPAPAPQHETHYLDFSYIGEYFAEMFGGDTEAYPGGALDFDDVNDFYTEYADQWSEDPDHGRNEVVATPHASIWDAASQQVWDISDDDWHSIISAAEPVWHQALHHVDSITAQLSNADLREITSRAGYWSSATSTNELRAQIVSTVLDQNSPDRSLEEAYADYVTWNRPELVGENGVNLGHHIAALLGDSDDVDMSSYPTKVFSFTQGFHDGGPVLVGTYEIAHSIYHSAIAEWGKDAPVGYLSVQELEMEPAGGYGRKAHEPVDDTWGESTADKHPWD